MRKNRSLISDGSPRDNIEVIPVTTLRHSTSHFSTAGLAFRVHVACDLTCFLLSPENSVKIVNPTLELATKWRIIVVSAARPLLSRENPLIDVSTGAGHVKVALGAFLWYDLDQYPRSVWIMVHQRNR